MVQQGLPIIQGKDPLAGLRQALTGFVGSTLQGAQNQQLSQQLSQLFPQQNFQGITNPLALQAGVQSALQQQQQQGALNLQAARPVTPRAGTFQQITDPDTGNQINALVDTISGRVIKKFGTIEEGLSAKDKIQVAVTQAKEFRADPRIKDLGIIERSERGMSAALNQARKGGRTNLIASDQALGVLFQKMLDPTSVVRESEFARTPQGASIINRITGAIKQLTTGGLGLEDEDRIALVDMARKLLTEAKISANRAFDEFGVRADEIGLNKKIVFGGAKKFDIPVEIRTGVGGNLTPAEQTELDALLKERDAISPEAELEALRRATPTIPPGGLGGRIF